MKYLKFIDDNEKINRLQKLEINKLLKKYRLDSHISVGCMTVSLQSQDFDKSAESDSYLYEKVNQITDDIFKKFNSDAQKIELVIDLCLDDKNPSTGVNLVKMLINNNKLKSFFEEGTLLITLTSMYISADFDRISENLLSQEEVNKILYCYRPIKDDRFDENRYAFPEYYMRFKDKLPNTDVIELLSNKTYYGNFWGMILARLVSEEGK